MGEIQSILNLEVSVELDGGIVYVIIGDLSHAMD